jgi:peroxiredoxin Q/BCP
MQKVGEMAPDFTLSDDHGRAVTLSKLRGKHVVLYFYPKDDTPGCTREACGFRDAAGEYDRQGVLVLGVSADTVASHAAFRDKFQLNFPLLADPDHKVCEAYGVWADQGKWGWGVSRHTFVIDPEGKVLRHYPEVDVNQHAAEILSSLR